MSGKSQQPALIEDAEALSIPKNPVAADSGLALVIERLAANPSVDVEKLKEIVGLQERILDREAKAAFDAAFAKMQAELPEVDEKGKITRRDGTVISRYARLEDIQQAIRPVLKAHGFAIRHRTEWPEDRKDIIRIVGILSHELGHAEESTFEAPMDRSEYRTDIQSQGSTVSYGRRYTTIDLLNITTRGVDNDGATAGRPAPPDGYQDAVLTLEAAAAQGSADLDKAWAATPTSIRTYIGKHDAQAYAALRKRASGGR